MPATATFSDARAQLAPVAQLARYAGASVTALAADTGVYLVLGGLGLAPAIAGGIGYLIGLALHYALSVSLVFDARASGKRHRRLVAEFAASGLAGLALTAAVIAIGTGLLGLALLPAKAAAVAISFAAVYALRRAVVFAAR
ncbi:MAG: GtrA family protein [Hyphomicrobiaceae bacterium]|nr:GtrA family protein [Hyphomicrobiaceae bacterium]